MSTEQKRFELRREAHEKNIRHLQEQVQLVLDELSFHENRNKPIMVVEPEWDFELEEEFGILRFRGKIMSLKKQLSDLDLEIRNNELALADLMESESARSNKH